MCAFDFIRRFENRRAILNMDFFPGILARKNESDWADMKQQNYQLIRLVQHCNNTLLIIRYRKNGQFRCSFLSRTRKTREIR